MEQAVNMVPSECENIENLFYKYLSYMSMLQYLAEQSTTNNIFYDKKWEEASQLWIELDAAKRAAETKYKPEGNWYNYEFDFEKKQVVFHDK